MSGFGRSVPSMPVYGRFVLPTKQARPPIMRPPVFSARPLPYRSKPFQRYLDVLTQKRGPLGLAPTRRRTNV